MKLFRKRPMCWIAIGFLLFVSVLVLGRSYSNETIRIKEYREGENYGLLQENDTVLLEGIIVSKEYKESSYGGYWKVVLKQVRLALPKEDETLDRELKAGGGYGAGGNQEVNGDYEVGVSQEAGGSQEVNISYEENKRYKKELKEKAEGKKVIHLEGKYLCNISKEESLELRIGQRILLEGKYALWEEPSNEGQFNSAKYYASQQILGQFKNGKIKDQSVKYSVWRENLWKIRQKSNLFLIEKLGEKEGAFISAMVLGEKGGLLEEDKSLYQRNGISHILAISGLHLSLLGMGVYNVIQNILPKRVAAIFTIIIMSLYCIFTGNSISTIRATIMFSLSLLATVLGRSYDSLSALGFTLILQLFFNPYVLNNSGFLLSFLAVLGVTFVAPGLQELFASKRKVTKSLCISLSATLTTLPVLLVNYGTYPWYSVFLNMLILPTMSVLLCISVLWILFWNFLFPFCGIHGMIVLKIGELLIFTIKTILKYYEICCDFFENVFGREGYLGAPHVIQIVVYGLLLGIFLCIKKQLPEMLRKMMLLSALSILMMRFSFGAEVTMLDVGQGDCVVIRNSNGNVYLSDCGSSSVSKVGKYRLIPFLRYKGYGKIKGIYVSHLDEDHVNGIRELLQLAPEEKIKIEYLFLPECVEGAKEEEEKLKELKVLASQNKTRVVYLKQGQKLQDGEMQFRCIYSGHKDTNGYGWGDREVTEKETAENRNNQSLVLYMKYKEFDLLLTGDVEIEGEKEILEYIDQGSRSGNVDDCDVLKVAHHGSKGSSCEEFIYEVHPKISLISCGKNNNYGHPHDSTLQRLDFVGSKIMTTVDCGAISFKIYGRKVKMTTMKEN